jgi:hypothetical protein
MHYPCGAPTNLYSKSRWIGQKAIGCVPCEMPKQVVLADGPYCRPIPEFQGFHQSQTGTYGVPTCENIFAF